MSEEKKQEYWWECANSSCDHWHPLNGIVKFIREELASKGWPQEPLHQVCPNCGEEQSLNIAFYWDGDSSAKKVAFVRHIVGLSMDSYLPMMWEWKYRDKQYPQTPYFSFNYILGQSGYGLTHSPGFNATELRDLFSLYLARAGNVKLPWTPIQEG